MISVRKLVKFYGPVRAVDRVSFDAQEGQIHGILGPNGAGKSTTIRILTGFLPPSDGTATINGHDVFTESLAVRHSIGYLPESTPLYTELTVAQQLHHFGRLHGMARADRRKRIADLTDRCGLKTILNRPIGNLSKGNRQRAGLAQALIHDPPVLILDEPTAGLDPAQVTEVRQLITDLGRTKTILISTHILPEVEKTCGRVVIIHEGRVVAQGTPHELTERVRSVARVILEVRGEAEAVKKVFEAQPRVGRVDVEADGPWAKAAVSPRESGEDVREVLGDLIREKGWPLRSLRHEASSLEEYFVQVTSVPAPEPADAPETADVP